MKTSPTGFGYWLAFAENVTPSPLAQDIAATCSLLQSLRAGWVAPRAGMDGWNDGGLTVEALAAYQSAGLSVLPWIYTRPKGIDATVNAAKALVATGHVTGIILDAEAEYLGEPAAAARLVDAMRSALPDVWLAHAPFDNIAFHPKFPWREMVRGSAKKSEPTKLDAVLPQLYAWEHNDLGHVFWQKKCETQWATWEAANPDAVVPRRWIGCAYRPALRGGKPTAALPLKSVVDDVVTFRQSNPEGSLYSIDAPIALGQRAILTALIELAGGSDALDLTTVLGQQQALARLGFSPGPIDGKKGQRTVLAILAFQKSAGLDVDGIVGPKTRAALKLALEASRRARRRSRSGGSRR